MYCLFALGVEYFKTQSKKTLYLTGLPQMTTGSSFDVPIITCVLTVRNQFSLHVSRMKVEGALYLKNQATRQEPVLGL